MHEKLADKLKSNIADLIHLKTESTHVADWNEADLAKHIQSKDFELQQTFTRTQVDLGEISKHFKQISKHLEG